MLLVVGLRLLVSGLRLLAAEGLQSLVSSSLVSTSLLAARQGNKANYDSSKSKKITINIFQIKEGFALPALPARNNWRNSSAMKLLF